jgi:outer membrane protein OmpA-like peptidoglycan-associated protein
LSGAPCDFRGVRALVIALLLSLSSAAAAQVGTFNVDRLRPTMSAEGVLGVASGEVGEHFDADAALILDWAINPLVVYEEGRDGSVRRAGALVGHRVGAHVIGSIALFDWARVGVDVPAVLVQTSDEDALGVPALRAGVGPAGFGDVRFVPRVRLLRDAEQGVDLALGVDVTVPSAFPAAQYAGDGFFTVTPELAASTYLEAVYLRVNGAVGYRARPLREVGSLSVGHEAVFGLGVRWYGGRWGDNLGMYVPADLSVSLNGAVGVAPAVDNIGQAPLEVRFGAGYMITEDLRVEAGVGAGLIAGAGTPDARFLVGLRWATRERDKDGDGVVDAEDACPREPEDVDRHRDWDGCPDLDNDEDGVPDELDECSFTPEDLDGFEDEDGCPEDADPSGPATKPRASSAVTPEQSVVPPETEPEPEPKPEPEPEPEPEPATVVIKKEKIEILEKVFFDVGTATIKERSYGVLRDVAAVLEAHPELTRLRVEGHTDSTGGEDANQRLSQRRAEAVVAFLAQRGVDVARLTPVGFGETRPVAPNLTARGRDQNRRVEFTILEREAP